MAVLYPNQFDRELKSPPLLLWTLVHPFSCSSDGFLSPMLPFLSAQLLDAIFRCIPCGLFSSTQPGILERMNGGEKAEHTCVHACVLTVTLFQLRRHNSKTCLNSFLFPYLCSDGTNAKPYRASSHP